MVFVIDRFFSTNKKDSCMFLKSDKYSVEQTITLIGFIIAIVRSVHSLPAKPSTEEIGLILQRIYGFRDVKEQYLKELNFFEKRLVFSKTLMMGFEMSGEFVVWIDANEADELYIRRNHNKFMFENIKQVEEIKKLLHLEKDA